MTEKVDMAGPPGRQDVRELQHRRAPHQLLPCLLLHVLSIRLFKDRRQNLRIDARDLSQQIPAPAVFALGMV